jgi:hypothetical protein
MLGLSAVGKGGGSPPSLGEERAARLPRHCNLMVCEGPREPVKPVQVSIQTRFRSLVTVSLSRTALFK